MTRETFANALREHGRSIQLTTDPDILRRAAVDGIEPRLLVTPATAEEVAQTVMLAHQHRVNVLARGGGSHMHIGGPPERIDVLISTQRLNRLLEHEGPDLTCHVEAGMPLAALQTYLASKGQRLSLDPADAEQSSIGGLLAVNASGPRRLRYGSARDLLIGLRVVQASGELARSGGRVVKNVAGYDLNKLYIGALGTLGIIVEANWKLHPLPAAERTLLLSCATLEAAQATILAITASQIMPAALELIDPAAATSFSQVHLPSTACTLAVQVEGTARSMQRQIDEIMLLARTMQATPGETLSNEAQSHFWHEVSRHTLGSITCKITLPVTEIARMMQHMALVCQRHQLEASTIAHAGNGILYSALRPVDAMPPLVAAIAELRQLVHTIKGHLIVERCPVELKRHIQVWGQPGPDFFLMQRLKQQFDPDRTFVQGRFIGGL